MSTQSLDADRKLRVELDGPRFAVGTLVIVTQHNAPDLLCRVVRAFPDEGAGFSYRVRAEADGTERVISEALMRDASPTTEGFK